MTKEIRAQSTTIAARAGISIPPTLPLLDDGLVIRNQDEVVDRLFCMHATAAASYKFGPVKALAWLRQERLEPSFTNEERAFLERGEGDPNQFQVRVEGMWALAWAVRLQPELNYWKDCDDRFVTMLPNLKISESSADWRRRASFRPVDDVVAACDLAYCLHWAVRQAEIDGKQPPTKLKQYVILERRRALEWVLSKEPWDSMSLDT